MSIVNGLHRDVLGCIGDTSMVALRNIVPENGSRVLLKLESENPTGSMKDRMALAMVEGAEAAGRLGTRSWSTRSRPSEPRRPWR